MFSVYVIIIWIKNTTNNRKKTTKRIKKKQKKKQWNYKFFPGSYCGISRVP